MRVFALAVILASALPGAVTLPLTFEPNRGQAPARSDFIARGQDYWLSLDAGCAQFTTHRSRIVATLAGSHGKARAGGEQPTGGVSNYLRGRDASRWITGVPNFALVRYRGVYPGIDVVYYGEGGALEYDFIVAPRADPSQIRIRYQGSGGVHLDAAGDLMIATPDGELRLHRPAVYQDIGGIRRNVAGRYVLRGDTVRFALARYDRRRPLVIDPALTWATYFGTAGADSGEAVALDAAGNIYISGTTVSPFGNFEVFFAKLNPAGATVLFQTAFGGSGNTYGHAMAVDSGGNIYLAGETGSADFPADQSYVYPYPGYSEDAFVSKIDPTGARLVYSHYFGGSGADAAFGIALDAANNAYVAGTTSSTDLITTNGSAQTRNAGNYDAFAVKFDANGNGVYSTFLGGSGSDGGYAIAVDQTGNAFITGVTASTNFPVTGSAYQAHNAGGSDAFVAKLAAANGALIFSTYLGGSGDDTGYGIAVDSGGAAYIAGETASSDFPVMGAYQKAYGGGKGNMFVTKIDGGGASLDYSTYLGGSGEDAAYAIAVDGGGNAYVTGSTASADFPVSDAFQPSKPGPMNAAAAGLSASGSSLLFSSYLGGSGTGGDFGNALAVSCSAGLVVAGTATSTDFPATAGTISATYQGGASDAFVAKVASGGGAPVLAPGGVVNGATFAAGAVAPGSLITIFGSTMALGAQSAAATPLPSSLAGAAVSINGNPVPIVYASAGQMNVQLPYEALAGSAVVTVANACGASAPAIFQVAPAAPFIFQTAAGGAIAQNQDFSVNGSDNPAKAGSSIVVYLTGIGPLDHAVPTGAPAPAAPLSRATLPDSATIGGAEAAIQFLGLTPNFVGLAQANLLVPASLGPGTYPVVITVGGVASNGPSVYIH